MDAEGQIKLRELNEDYERVTGNPFAHFYCPLLYCDEEAELCRGHIVNQAFPGIGRQWVVQRKDVDNFYGTCFESDFIDIQYKDLIGPTCIVDRGLASKFRTTITRKGVSVPYYYPSGQHPLPPGHSKIQIDTERGTIDLRLKMEPVDVASSGPNEWQIEMQRDLRLPALVSLLKAAHLTMFRMLGYRYVFSVGGNMLGSALGKFYQENLGLDKSAVVENARHYFKKYCNLVRPVVSHKPLLGGTVADNQLYICETTTKVPWAFMVFVRTSDTAVHAVLVPFFEDKNMDAIARFFSFMADGRSVEGRFCRYENDVFQAWPTTTVFQWPPADIDDSWLPPNTQTSQ